MNAPRFAGPDEDEDNSPTEKFERPSIADNVKLTSQTQIRCAIRLGHMSAQKRRAK